MPCTVLQAERASAVGHDVSAGAKATQSAVVNNTGAARN
jgi:hypothetical protein